MKEPRSADLGEGLASGTAANEYRTACVLRPARLPYSKKIQGELAATAELKCIFLGFFKP
jgi:hypothetical protein